MATETRRYGKPPLFFEGESGREILEYIMNTPAPDLSDLFNKVEQEEKKILKGQKNEI